MRGITILLAALLLSATVTSIQLDTTGMSDKSVNIAHEAFTALAACPVDNSCHGGCELGMKIAKSTAYFVVIGGGSFESGVKRMHEWLSSHSAHIDRSAFLECFNSQYKIYYKLYSHKNLPCCKLSVPKQSTVLALKKKIQRLHRKIKREKHHLKNIDRRITIDKYQLKVTKSKERKAHFTRKLKRDIKLRKALKKKISNNKKKCRFMGVNVRATGRVKTPKSVKVQKKLARKEKVLSKKYHKCGKHLKFLKLKLKITKNVKKRKTIKKQIKKCGRKFKQLKKKYENKKKVVKVAKAKNSIKREKKHEQRLKREVRHLKKEIKHTKDKSVKKVLVKKLHAKQRKCHAIEKKEHKKKEKAAKLKASVKTSKKNGKIEKAIKKERKVVSKLNHGIKKCKHEIKTLKHKIHHTKSKETKKSLKKTLHKVEKKEHKQKCQLKVEKKLIAINKEKKTINKLHAEVKALKKQEHKAKGAVKKALVKQEAKLVSQCRGLEKKINHQVSSCKRAVKVGRSNVEREARG